MVADLIAFAAALIATLALTPMAQALAVRSGIVDCPDGRRKLQQRPVPLLGGLAVFGGWWLGLAITALLGIPLRWPAAMPQAALTLGALSLVGICDDAWSLRARWKLLAQIVATLPIALSGYGLGQVACCGWTFDLGICGPAATVFWLIVGINALNLIDGMDGMASLTGLCIALTIAALDMQTGGSHVGTFATGLAGALAGFLVFNFPPAKIYLGDAGSMVIGLALALASMRAARTESGVTNLTPMLALMALPLADTALAVLRRSLSGRGIWYPDRAHVHHRLLDRGLRARSVLALVAGFSLVWGLVVVAARANRAERFVWAAASLVGLLAVRWKLAGHHEWSLLANSVWNSVRTRTDLPTLAELESLGFADAWKRLQTALELYPLHRLTVSVGQADGGVHEHHWLKETLAADQVERLVIEVLRQTPAAMTCRLRAETPNGQILRQSSQLLEVLERFAHFWAAHPETVPPAALDSVDSGEVVVLSLPQPPGRQQQNRAA